MSTLPRVDERAEVPPLASKFSKPRVTQDFVLRVFPEDRAADGKLTDPGKDQIETLLKNTLQRFLPQAPAGSEIRINITMESEL